MKNDIERLFTLYNYQKTYELIIFVCVIAKSRRVLTELIIL